jgi:CBS domain-containing protein
MARVQQLLASKGSAVFSVAPEEPVLRAIQLMAEYGVGALLVMEGDKLSGIVSERDYARKVILLGRSSAETPVWQIMSAPVICVAPTDSIEQCMRLMTERKIRHLPVTEQGKVLGVLSVGDVIKQTLADKERELDQMRQYVSG